MTPQQFISKWQRVTLSERSACQQHFLDLCDLLGQPKPAAADPEGTWYTFEKGVQTSDDAQGWADVWMRDHFGWEYKGKRKDLKAAYAQLLRYREALENPPLLVVCDMDRFEVHTNFTGTAKKVHAFDLAGLADGANRDILRRAFAEPQSLKPGITSESMTVHAAERFAKLADGLRQKGIEPLRAAHFLMKLMFCMFGEDTALLPPGLFAKLLDTGKANPAMLPKLLGSLFEAMRTGGIYGSDLILWFNGGLFDDAEVLPLTQQEINTLANINKYDWAAVEPSIFGTLFERTLDPAKRSQIGAHYTHRGDIETLLKPVLLAPLQREWATVKEKCEADLWPKVVKTSRVGRATASPTKKDSPARKTFDRAILDFLERLAHVRVLDPACGSGNFLYVAIHMLLDLEKEVITYAADRGLAAFPRVTPTQLSGLEINPYAQQLAQVVIWIGYLQWMHYNGFKMPDHPVLTPIESVRQMDAILDLSDPEHPKEPEWPEAEFIVGNPPFLGKKLLRRSLDDIYVDAMYKVWDGRVSRDADLCCYWFEKARWHVEVKKCRRAGLLATQGIRGGANRKVLARIKSFGDIFFAESDRNWVLDGANVHVSMVGFDDGSEPCRTLDSLAVTTIHANLTAISDVTTAKPLNANTGISLRPPEKGGKFEIEDELAQRFLCAPNPHLRPNSDVLRPWMNAETLVNTRQSLWIIDFPPELNEATASQYELPFSFLSENVRSERSNNRDERLRRRWWIHRRSGDGVRNAQVQFSRLLWTPRHSKHRLFAWCDSIFQPDTAIYAFATDSDYDYGILQSRPHEV